VVDNASTDGVAELVEKYLTNNQIYNFSWKLIHEPTPGLIHARLAGMKAAASDIMLFCDDDNTLCDTYVQTGFEIMHANPKIGVLGGLGIPEFESEKPDWFDTFYHSYAVGAQADKDGKIDKYPAEVYGAGSFFRKAPLQRFYDLGFKSIFKGRTGKVLSAGDDVEWCYSLQLVGYEIWYNSSLTFLHFMPAKRLQWDYYIKMKSGIASGSAGFYVYNSIFYSRKKNIFILFYLKYYKIKLTYLFLYIKHKIMFDSIKKNKFQELKLEIIKNKFSSYLFNAKSHYNHFLLIKNIIAKY
jgi:glycosyltransferase involved in cell wall biosynthesis